MPDLYLYNGSNQFQDVAVSIEDLAQKRVSIVPPGSQGRVSISDQDSFNVAVAFYQNFGAVDHGSLAAPEKYTGLTISVGGPAMIKGATPPIVQLAAKPAKPADPVAPVPPAPAPKKKGGK